MSILLIDRGNTRLKWQLIKQSGVCRHGANAKSEELSNVFHGINAEQLTAVTVSNVGEHAFESTLKQWAEVSGAPEPQFIHSVGYACGVTNAYDTPAQLGVDRWLAIIAGHHHYQGNVCVVDVGTALTMDFVQANGQHLGGFIVPGYELAVQSLLKNTKKIQIDEQSHSTTLGVNTTQAVLMGVQQMLVSFVEQKVAEMKQELDSGIQVVMTGGGSEQLMPSFKTPIVTDQDLIFKGMRLMAKID